VSHFALVTRIGEAKKQADRNGLRPRAPDESHHSREISRGWPQDDAAIGSDPLAQTESPLARNQRRWRIDEEIIEPRSYLTADFEDVFEPGCCYQGDASTSALKKGVCSYGCATNELEIVPLPGGAQALSVWKNLLEGFNDGLRGML
jgi:hypothetical protein